MTPAKQGLFITFEGPDGAGKTTQLRQLAQYLQQEQGLDIVTTREPGGTLISDKIRAILLDPENEAMFEETEILLYAASRAQHVKEKILPALQQGKIVLCDRFVDASVAYQGYGLGISPQKIIDINRFATGGVQPDRSYLLDVPVETGRERLMKGDLDRIEQKGKAYHQKVRDGFHAIMKQQSERIHYVRADQSIADLHRVIREDVLSFLKEEEWLT